MFERNKVHVGDVVILPINASWSIWGSLDFVHWIPNHRW
jgi:hypothetical protein